MPRGKTQLDRGLEEAAGLIASSDPTKRKISKTERFLDKSGDLISTVSGVAAANAFVENNASAIVGVLKLEAGDFVQSSKLLVSALDEVAKLHPFIQVAVLVFKTAVNLVIKRRENDGKVLALNVQMRDMMSTLLLLKGLTNSEESSAGSSEMTIEARLTTRMTAMVQSMKDCSKVCDTYNKNRVILKILSSFKWEQKFADIAKQFASHAAKLQEDLSMYSSIAINAANKTLATLSDKMDEVMATVFKSFQSPEERELAAFVSSKGGPDKVKGDNTLLEQVLRKQKELEDGQSKGDRAVAMTVNDLRVEMRKDVKAVLDENSRTFNQKFEMQQRQIAEEMKNAVYEARDDIIDAVLAGPHERVEDEDMRAIWKEMGWKGSVKARHLVLAVHDHFAEKRRTARPASGRLLTETDTVEPDIPDDWALGYINIIRIQSLIEAIDDDVSSFVTVAEVNTFTRARPDGWSLPYWIAYNTIGVELSINFYYRRINQILLDIFEASEYALPANRSALNEFLCPPYITLFETVLSGIQDSVAEQDFDWDSDTLFLKFKTYILDEEEKFSSVVKSLDYHIDDESTLHLISDTSRPEKYLLTLFYILLHRGLEVVKEASSRVLHEDALDKINSSFDTMWDATTNRAESLKTIFRLQNLDSSDQLSIFCFGMYRYVLGSVNFEEKFWQQEVDFSDNQNDQASESDATSDADEDASGSDPTSDVDEQNSESGSTSDEAEIGTDDGTTSVLEPREADTGLSPSDAGKQNDTVDAAVTESGLDSDANSLHGEVEDESTSGESLDHLFKPTMNDLLVYQMPPSLDIAAQYDGGHPTQSIIGNWSGRYYEETAGSAFTLTISSEELDGSFTGRGNDVIGEFVLSGTRKQDSIFFTKTYAQDVEPEESHRGKVNEFLDEIDGDWGNFTPTENGGATGTFTMTRKPLAYVIFRPSEDEFDTNKPRALWKFALNVAMHVAGTKVLVWSNLKKRRDTRIRIAELREKADGFSGLNSDELEEYKGINFVNTPEDLNYWNAVSKFFAARRVLHGASCNVCSAWPIKTTRLVCIQCSDGCDTADFCVGCVDKSIRVEKKHFKKRHVASHSVLQMRTAVPSRYTYSVLQKAQVVLSDAQSELKSLDSHKTAGVSSPTTEDVPQSAAVPSGDMRCMSCRKPVSPPFWCCIACEGDAHLCLHCNNRVQREQPWLFERLISPTSGHTWAHLLVLVQPLENEAPDYSVEERLQTLEDSVQFLGSRIQGVESMITTRFQTMERLIMELVDANSRVPISS